MTAQLGALWERYGKLSLADVPDEARTAACQCILDWLGCALSGSTEPLARILREELADEAGPATVIGAGQRAPATVAALLNGAAGHALDYDDTNLVGGLHATTAVLPAALALAQQSGASGADLLAAYIAGVEVCARLRVAIGEEHYSRGWHITSTLGVFGAAAAAGRLLGLDGEQFGRAVGLASSQVGGVHANFGTMTKPFHAGFAAERGLLSARLARRGFTASPAAFERAFAQMSGDIDWTRLEPLEGTFAVTDTLLKRFASGHGTQATILATQALMAGGLVAEDIVHAEVHAPTWVPPSGYGVRVPRIGIEAKFSLPGVCALVLLGHDLAVPATFSDENVHSPAFRDLISRIELVGDPAFEQGEGEIVVATRGGATVRQLFPRTRDSKTVESRAGLVSGKFRAIAGPVIGEDAAKRLRDLVLDLAAQPGVAEMCALAERR
ncbi:MAG TPA: MmgE/PrpD family protein [Trebonia sp.]|jgi:2-methylcitrate dehydratase PrpD|nr:MmgE/PrpD family protein [Trebonia sp.]